LLFDFVLVVALVLVIESSVNQKQADYEHELSGSSAGQQFVALC
jgi:hypothetical protein